jgi:TP901 family phage tail tape measure protein
MDLGVRYGQSMEVMTKATYQAISAGVDMQDIGIFLDAAGKLAIGGVTDMTTAVDGLTSIMNAWGYGMDKVTDIADKMFVAMKAGKTTIGELSQSIGQVAPIAAQMGIGIDQVLAMTATLTKGGLATSEAITGIRQAMVTVMRQSPLFVKNAKKFGIEYDEAKIQTMGFANWLAYANEKVKQGGGKMSDLFRNVQGLAAVLTLTGKGMKDNAEIMEQMGNSSGQAQKAFEKMEATYNFKVAQMEAASERASIKMGDFFHPIAEAWVEFKTAFFNDISRKIDDVTWGWKFGLELMWISIKMSWVKGIQELLNYLAGVGEKVGKIVSVINPAAGKALTKENIGQGQLWAEDKIKAYTARIKEINTQSQKDGYLRAQRVRDKMGKNKKQPINVNNQVNIGNKKVHESQRDWEEEFLLRNFQPIA